MGSGRQYDGVRAASASTIEIDFYYAGQRCRERIKVEPSPANLKRAALHRAAVLDAIDKGEFDYATTFPKSKNAEKFAKHQGDVLTLETFLEGWLDRQKPMVKASTWEDYRKTVHGVWIPLFGQTALAALTRADVRDACSKMTAGNKRIGNILSPLRIALGEAAEDSIIPVNPIAGWSYRKVEPPKEEDDTDPFGQDEQTAILQQLTGQAKNFVTVALWSGLRTSELVALNWTDIDFRRGKIRVRRALTQAATRRGKVAGDIQPETTKTTAGRRDVDILGPALQALIDQKTHTLLKGEEVFQNPRTGERWTGDQPIRKTMWQPALARAKVRYRNPYQTRHTYASMMLTAGEHPMWVAQQMGHRDWGMIRKVYGRFIPDAATNAGRKAEAMFAPAGEPGGSKEAAG